MSAKTNVSSLPETQKDSGKSGVTARGFLLSIAGMFDSGKPDVSEKAKQEVAEAIKRKYGGDNSTNNH